MGQKLQNKRSASVVNDLPKLPVPSQIEYGEIAVNFADGYETLSIKNNADEIATFSCDETINEKINDSLTIIRTWTINDIQ